MRTPPRLALVGLLLFWAACSSPSGCACPGFTALPQGAYSGERLDTAASARLTADGFRFLNQNSSVILEMFAPGGQLVVPVPCTITSVPLLGSLTIADNGQLYCTQESCGQLDGRCDGNDLPVPVTIAVSSLSFRPTAPDIVEATVRATVQTGKLMVSSVSRSAAICFLLGGGAVKCGVDFDSSRVLTPPDNELVLDLKLAIDQKWDRLLYLEVANIGGGKACGSVGASPPPACIDPADIVISREGTCTVCNAANFSVMKQILVDTITAQLKTQISDALTSANCAPCGPGGTCPTSAMGGSVCQVKDGGVGECMDTTTNRCVPGLLGMEGRLDVGVALGGLGAPGGSAMDISIGAGGAALANATGATVGLLGGAKELAVADCVAPRAWARPPALPLPDFDAEAPGLYDLGLSVSGQYLSEMFFRAQQSGALCLTLGTAQVAQFESGLLGTLLPSLNRLTGGASVPLLAVVKPVNPPTATLGAGTVDANGKPLAPLVRVDWKGVELDVYALLEDRMARLFTLRTDLSLPFALEVSNCDRVTPIIGDLKAGVANVEIVNSEMLAEPLDTLKALVPSLLGFIEPQLAQGFAAFALPDFQGFRLDVKAAKGIGPVAGSQTYNHLGFYASLFPSTQVCPSPTPSPLRGPALSLDGFEGDSARVQAPFVGELSFRVNGGFWSTWRKTDAMGRATVTHPSLALDMRHDLELRFRDGSRSVIGLSPDQRAPASP